MEEPENLWPPTPKDKGIVWPSDTRPPVANDLCVLGLVRKLDILAFHLAGLLGTLKVATHKGQWAWIITDRAALGAEARRMDGALWDGTKKSLSLVGSKKNAPVGLVTFNADLDRHKNIVLVEGAPDYFAALALAIDSPINFRVATMLGASCSITVDPGYEFGVPGSELHEVKVLIIPHNDLSGQAAAGNWSRQLYSLGAARVRVQTLPDSFKDLNDFVSAPDEDPKRILQWLQA